MGVLFLGDANARLVIPPLVIMEERQIQPLDRSTKNICLVAVSSKRSDDVIPRVRREGTLPLSTFNPIDMFPSHSEGRF